MTTLPALAAPRPWYRPAVADLVFVLMLALVAPHAPGKLLSDPGLGWHLRNIDAMIAEGRWLSTDPFTLPNPERTGVWKTNQWLGELPLWLGERWAGREGVAAVAILLIALTLRLL